MVQSDVPFEFKRLQFPVWFEFASTINETQDQSLYVCDMDLEIPCFFPGQLYVICSRVKKPSALYI